MTVKLNKYLALKKRVEDATKQVDQADGAIGEVMKQLKREFDCSTLNEAKRKLKQLEKQEVESKEKFDSAVEKFEKDWPDNRSEFDNYITEQSNQLKERNRKRRN